MQFNLKTCPECSVKLPVVRTITMKSGLISRRRECPKCGYEISTTEAPQESVQICGFVATNARQTLNVPMHPDTERETKPKQQEQTQ